MNIIANKMIHRKKQTGSLSIELMVAIGIMTILLSTLAGMGFGFKQISDHHWARHTMLAAGQAQMDALVTTGKPIDEKTFKRIWPKVQYTLQVSDGEGQWQGLKRIELHLSSSVHQKTTKTSLTRYVRTDKELQ